MNPRFIAELDAVLARTYAAMEAHGVYDHDTVAAKTTTDEQRDRIARGPSRQLASAIPLPADRAARGTGEE